MCTVYDGEPELAGLSRLRKSQVKGLLVSPGPRAPASSTGEAVNVDNPQELLKIAQHHCQAIVTIIDQLTENKSNTELRLLSQRLQRLAFHAAPRSRDG